MIKVRADIRFYDLEENKTRNVGDEWEVTKPRCEKLLALGFITVLEVEDKLEKTNKAKTKTTARTTRKPNKTTPEV